MKVNKERKHFKKTKLQTNAKRKKEQNKKNIDKPN